MELKDIISDLLQTPIETEDDLNGNFTLIGMDPLWHEKEHGKSHVVDWVQFTRLPQLSIGDDGVEVQMDGTTLLPQGLFMKFDITGRDPSKWALTGILYADEFYESADKFRKAYSKPGFKKLVPGFIGDWYSTDHNNVTLPFEDLPPPMEVQPAGQRFSVDKEQGYIEWMGFTFYTTFTRDTGMKVYNIEYNGERIVYEISMQEAMAHYAANNPVQSGTSFLDSYYGFGPAAFSQIPDFDMPTYAMCLDSKWHASEISKTHPCGISVFEHDMGYVMQRHSTQNYVSATKNIALTIRSVSTLGNYDYTSSINLFLDGSIEVVIQASGYISATYYYNNEDYGYQIHDNLSESMHDHVLNYKVDLDILGGKNTLLKHSVEPISKKYKWSNNIVRNTMHVVKKAITNERDGKINWGANSKDHYIVAGAKNEFGEERGYRIMPSRGGAGMACTVKDSTNLQESATFADHSFYVTKYKDREGRVGSPWNAFDTAHPLRRFADYLEDEEDLEDEDLVLWVNLGMHHVPHTGDLPNTVMTTAQSVFILTPHNIFTSDQSRRARNQIRIDYNSNETTHIHTFGSQAPSGTINLADIAWDPTTYNGDVAVRKYPYDPTNPFNDTNMAPGVF